MAVAPQPDATEQGAPSTATTATGRRVGFETVLAVAGALAVVGFALPWIDLGSDGRVSGLDVTRDGGLWTGLAAIPVLGLITAVTGGLRWKMSRYAGLMTAIAMLVPVAYLLATHWPWLYTIPVGIGLASVVVGKLGRVPWVSLPLGGVLLALSVVGPLIAGDAPLFDFAGSAAPIPEAPVPEAPAMAIGLGAFEGLGIAAVPLLALGLLMPVCGAWLLWAGLRKRGRERALVAAGWSLTALGAYVAAIVAFGPALTTAGIGLWMTALGGAVLLVGSRPFGAKREKKPDKKPEKKPDKKPEKSEAPAKAASKEAKPGEAKPAAAKPAAAKPAATKPAATKPAAPEPAAATSTPATAPAPKPAKAKAADANAARAAKAEQLAKLAKLRELKKLKLIKARKLEKAKAARAEAEAAKEDADAAQQEAATAKAGEALARDPEPVFAADPTAPPPPENEDREALMQRMGVKKPPPPSDNELADMLAALKKRAGDS